MIWLTTYGIIIMATVFPLADNALKPRLIRWWCSRLVAAFNIKVITMGHVPQQNTKMSNTMFVANHVSSIDILALNSITPLRFIAKSEIKHWPVLGYLAGKANTLFTDRTKKQDAQRTIEMAHQSLQSGDNLCFFPEGTTTDGTEIKPFKTSLIQSAILAKSTVWPVAIRYPMTDGSINTQVAYAGETTMVESIRLVLKQKQPVVALHFLPPIAHEAYLSMDRRELTLHVEGLIRKKLNL